MNIEENFADLVDVWDNEFSCLVTEDIIDGKKYWKIENIIETNPNDTLEKREWLKNAYKLQQILSKNATDKKEKERIAELLRNVSPMIGKIKF